MEKLREKKGFICDMDGVIYWGGRLLPGVKEFVDWLQREGKRFLFDQQQRSDTFGTETEAAGNGAGY